MLAIVFSLLIKKPVIDEEDPSDSKEDNIEPDKEDSEVVHSMEDLTREDFFLKYG